MAKTNGSSLGPLGVTLPPSELKPFTPMSLSPSLRSITPASRRAFTLIELLTCIAIISVLAALLLSVFSKVTTARNNAMCLGNLRQIANATLLYCADKNGAFPPALSFPPSVTEAFSPWNRALSPYLGLPSDVAPSPIFKCPADPRSYEATPGHYARSYAFNATPSFSAGNSNDYMGLMATTAVNGVYPTRKLNQITVPGQTIIVAEWWTNPSGIIRDNWQDSYNFSTLSTGWVTTANSPISEEGRPNEYYHGRGINTAFADGHVGTMTPTEIIRDYAATRLSLWRAVR